MRVCSKAVLVLLKLLSVVPFLLFLVIGGLVCVPVLILDRLAKDAPRNFARFQAFLRDDGKDGDLPPMRDIGPWIDLERTVLGYMAMAVPFLCGAFLDAIPAERVLVAGLLAAFLMLLVRRRMDRIAQYEIYEALRRKDAIDESKLRALPADADMPGDTRRGDV